MRAVLEGLDPVRSWRRYLAVDGAREDARWVTSTLHWIRDEFAAAALREHRPGTARLVLMDAQQLLSGEVNLPSLDIFAAEAGLEDFGQAEQIEAFEARYGGELARLRRRQRLLARQLEALRWLETLVAQPPQRGDPVRAWLHPLLATKLEAAGLPTLQALVDRINGRGAHWSRGVRGLGAAKAQRIVDWLRMQEVALGCRVGAHVDLRPAAWPAALRAQIQAPGLDVLPLEKLQLPAWLNGHVGTNRGPVEACALVGVDTDLAAVGCWLAHHGRRSAPEAAAALNHTQRAYRKEAERLLLWAALVRQQPLSNLDAQDAQAYLQFLADPQPRERWCSAQVHPRWSPLWRPLVGPLSPVSLAQAQRVLRGLSSYLVAQGYWLRPLWDGPLPAPVPVRVPRPRWAEPPPLADAQAPDTAWRLQLARALLQAGDWRLSRLCELRLADVQLDVPAPGQCTLCLPAQPTQRLVLPATGVQVLQAYLQARGLPQRPGIPWHPHWHLLAASPRAPRLKARPPAQPGAGIQAGTLRDQLQDAHRAAQAAGDPGAPPSQ
jgi:hypothetical protein